MKPRLRRAINYAEVNQAIGDGRLAYREMSSNYAYPEGSHRLFNQVPDKVQQWWPIQWQFGTRIFRDPHTCPIWVQVEMQP